MFSNDDDDGNQKKYSFDRMKKGIVNKANNMHCCLFMIFAVVMIVLVVIVTVIVYAPHQVEQKTSQISNQMSNAMSDKFNEAVSGIDIGTMLLNVLDSPKFQSTFKNMTIQALTSPDVSNFLETTIGNVIAKQLATLLFSSQMQGLNMNEETPSSSS